MLVPVSDPKFTVMPVWQIVTALLASQQQNGSDQNWRPQFD